MAPITPIRSSRLDTTTYPPITPARSSRQDTTTIPPTAPTRSGRQTPTIPPFPEDELETEMEWRYKRGRYEIDSRHERDVTRPERSITPYGLERRYTPFSRLDTHHPERTYRPGSRQNTDDESKYNIS
jgi:hypothetical protein